MDNSYSLRLNRLQQLLVDASCEAFLVDDPINLFYLTGLDLSEGKLVVTQEGATLIVDHRYFERCQRASPFPVVIEETKAMERALQGIHTLGFNREITTYGAYVDLHSFAEELKPPLHLIPMGNRVKELRAIKEEAEVALLRKAAALGSEGFHFVCRQLKEGVTEEEVAVALEIFWKQKGAEKVAFSPNIAFGTHGSMPHHKSGSTRLRYGDPVLIDIGVSLNHYLSDMTRVVFFGEPSIKIRKVYETVLSAQEAALTVCRPGTTVAELDTAARLVIEKEGYGENFTHSIGHGIGLEIHEDPVLKNQLGNSEKQLKEGMVMTVEPGIYLPNVGGVRIEDTVVITSNGHKNLTTPSKDIQIISGVL